MRRSGGQTAKAAVKLKRGRSAALILAVLLAAGGASAGANPASSATAPQRNETTQSPSQDTAGGIGPQYVSTYQRHANPPVLIRNATIMTATGQEIQGGSILLRDRKIVAVGTTVEAPSDATVVDGTG